MGERGPAKMPTKLKLLHGETRESRLNRTAPRPRSGLPKMPIGMSLDAKKVWRRIIRDFGATGVLTAADTDVLRAYCEVVVRYSRAAEMLERSGPLKRSRGGLVKNPLHQVVRDNAVLLRAFAREIGLSPAGREGLTLAEGHAVKDPLGAWMESSG